jgi:flagellin
MTAINTNVNSLVTQNALRKNEVEMSTAMTRLSTGKRINTAADDAAGMAIASRMTSQIKGLNQAVRNAQDATSMVQTADGATLEISNMLQRMRELSVQSLNGTNTANDRVALDTEFQALLLEVDRVAENTQWNGRNVLDGSVDVAQSEVNHGKIATSAVDTTNDKVTLNAHGFADGQVVKYHHGGGTAAGGLTNDQEYFVVGSTTNTFQLASSAGGSAISITGTGNADQWFGTTAPAHLSYQVGANSNQTVTMSFGDFKTDSANGVYGSAINYWNIKTESAANTALSGLTSSINNVNAQRATFGSTVNRLAYAIDNLANVSLNAEASRSRVEDADYAQETSQLARTQIIQQAGTAMLAQANALPQTVLALLK